MTYDIFRQYRTEVQELYTRTNFFEQECLDPNKPDQLEILYQLIAFRQNLLVNGWEPIPVQGKSGLMDGFTSGLITPERVARETGIGVNKLNTGIRTGLPVGADTDLRDPEHASQIRRLVHDLLGSTPLVRYGSKGAMDVYYNPEEFRGKLALTTVDGTRVFEILGRGFQFVAYGRHPEGMNYRWEDQHPGVYVLSDLPVVTTTQLRELMTAVRSKLTVLGYEFKQKEEIHPNPPRTKTQYNNDYEDTTALCRAALAVVPNDVDREDWITLCLSIKDAGLDYSDWADWCYRWEGGTNSESEIQAAWNSCRPYRVTFRTLLAKADQADSSWRKQYHDRRVTEIYDKYAKQMKGWPYHRPEGDDNDQ